MRLFLAIGGALLAACAGACSATSDGGATGGDDAAAPDAMTSGLPSDAGSPIDSSVARDSSVTPSDSGPGVDSGIGPGPDAGCAFDSIGTGVSGASCSKYELVTCSGTDYTLSCDCATNLCTCQQDNSGYASFAPPSALCADADGGCASTTGLRALAETSCGIFY